MLIEAKVGKIKTPMLLRIASFAKMVMFMPVEEAFAHFRKSFDPNAVMIIPHGSIEDLPSEPSDVGSKCDRCGADIHPPFYWNKFGTACSDECAIILGRKHMLCNSYPPSSGWKQWTEWAAPYLVGKTNENGFCNFPGDISPCEFGFSSWFMLGEHMETNDMTIAHAGYTVRVIAGRVFYPSEDDQ